MIGNHGCIIPIRCTNGSRSTEIWLIVNATSESTNR
uniref:Uncharacterized protein n=1 Tax=Parascaris univalens TaxID=6257 RepID=A0A915APY0_PARUN